MKKNIIYSTLMLLVAVSTFTACSSDEDLTHNTNASKSWTISVPASKSATSRALTVDGTKIAATWSTNENIAVMGSDNTTNYGSIAPVADGATAQMTGTLSDAVSNLTKGTSLNLYFPATAYTSGTGVVYKYTDQDGILETIAKKYDYSTANVTVSSIDATNKTIIASPATFANQQAIAGFTFVDKSNTSTAISVKKLEISAASGKLVQTASIGSSATTYTYGNVSVELTAATTDEIYVALNNQSGASDTYTFDVTDNDGNEWMGKAKATLLAGKYYPVGQPLQLEQITGTLNEHKWVKLALGGPKWGTMNIGATTTEDTGNYYKWGATAPYANEYYWSESTPSGRLSSNIELPASNDIATIKWSSPWKIPTKKQFDVLISSDYTWTKWSNSSYTKFEVKCNSAASTGKSIFFRFGGLMANNVKAYDNDNSEYYWGCYWSTTSYNEDSAYFLQLSLSGRYVINYGKTYGFLIRPIMQ